jgi:hypothetical protein
VTSYQRGNRDGLLSFAEALDVMAATWQEEARSLDKKVKMMPVASEQHKMTVTNALFRASAYRDAAARARRAAESLPIDPETAMVDANREDAQ